MNRIGPKMAEAIWIVDHNPGIVPLQVAKQLHIAAKYGNNMGIGYDPVNRAIRDRHLICYPCPENKSRSRLLTAEQDRALILITNFARAC